MIAFIKRIMLFSAWGLIFFIPKESRKRFLPVSIFTTFLVSSLVVIGKEYDFWRIHGGDRRKFAWNAFSIFVGFLPIGNFIMFHLFYGKFKLFLLGNFILNMVYAFFGIPIFDKLKMVKYVRFNKFWHVITTMIFSLLGYGYQNFLEKNLFKKRKS
jgi:hypothetical protein